MLINPNISEKLIICPACKGKGTIEKRIDNHSTDYMTVPCRLCKGKRILKRKVTIELLTI